MGQKKSEKKDPGFRNQMHQETSPYLRLGDKTNDWVRSKINFFVGQQETLLATVKRRKLAWFGYVARHDSLPKLILQGILESGRRRGRQRKCWMDNIKKWTSTPMLELLTRTSYRKVWKRISAEPHLLPTSQSIEGLK